jgi:hypothetical protein
MKTFRRVVAAVGVAVLAIVLSGCVKAESSVELREDGTLTLTIEQTISKDSIEDATGYTPDQATDGIRDLIKTNYGEDFEDKTSITETDDSVIATFTQEGTYDNQGVHLPDDQSLPMSTQVKDGKIDFILDITTYAEDNGFRTAEAFQKYYSEFTFSVTFPGAVDGENTNGTVNGRTVTWDTEKTLELINSGSGYKASGSQGGTPVFLFVLGGALIVGVIVGLLVIYRVKVTKRK